MDKVKILISCPTCKQAINSSSLKCPNCGKRLLRVNNDSSIIVKEDAEMKKYR